MEKPKDSLELNSENMKRLEVLMGPDYNGMEMQDYLSYLHPEQVSKEIDIFEEKLSSGRQSREQVIAGFKAHLGYLAA